MLRTITQNCKCKLAGSTQSNAAPRLIQAPSTSTRTVALARLSMRHHWQKRSTRRAHAVIVRSQEPGQEEEPPWVRREKERELQAAESAKGGFKLPWGLALLFSVFTTIAATGSIFEYVDKNPVFGVLQPDNPLWAPVLLFMAITGYPMAAYLFKLGVDGFNDYSEAMDRMDGYRK